jgi:hypothetical protein
LPEYWYNRYGESGFGPISQPLDYSLSPSQSQIATPPHPYSPGLPVPHYSPRSPVFEEPLEDRPSSTELREQMINDSFELVNHDNDNNNDNNNF